MVNQIKLSITKVSWCLVINMELISFPIILCTSEPSVTEDELKLMLRVAELSGAIEEEEQVCMKLTSQVLLSFGISF